MNGDHSPRIDHHFASLADPRRARVTHPLINIVTIALCGTIAGADDLVAMTHRARQHKDWLGQFLDFRRGIPSHDRLNMVFRRLKPAEFRRRLPSRLGAQHDPSADRLIAIDGKTARHSFDTATARPALHPVDAWAVSARLSPGCVAVDQKRNEITAIPELLRMLDLAGAIVTIDAMGCQAEIARQVVEGGGDSILAVKRNQETLHEGIEDFFLDNMDDDLARTEVTRHETIEDGHGRQEHRTYYVCDVPADLPDARRWKGLVQIGMAVRETTRGGKPSDAVRYYFLSERLSAKRFGALVRGHRGGENSLHWQVEASFGEDQGRTRKDHAQANPGVPRRTSPSLLRNETSNKIGIKDKRLAAGWNTDYFRKVLFG